MFRKQTAAPSRLRARLNYANVMATLAVILALGGTATAAITLPNDSVGAPQIQTDAVRSPEVQADAIRSPEIQADAVRSSEIEADAVRSSEILNDSITLADISDDAQGALDEPRVRASEEYGMPIPLCSDKLLTTCSNMTSINLPEGRWLVQAKLGIVGNFGTDNRCGLVESDTSMIDFAREVGRGTNNFGYAAVMLMDVLTTAPGVDSTVVALRCTEEEPTENLQASNIVLTAVEVKPLGAE